MPDLTVPLRLGLTGGIGSGKSTVAAIWREAGHRVIDLDAHSRAVLDVPGDGVEEAVARFGEEFRAAGGTIDRAAMARLVFTDAAARADLERIVLSRVDEAVAREEREAARAGSGSSSTTARCCWRRAVTLITARSWWCSPAGRTASPA
ncbi:dephospho-CoA kinase [Brachybacterium sp. Z12]|uniref:dephospho-CoA kinase n=1 Tax=Brachybacterium sp. Z12 TaxID=2759167 RepID=UPI00223C3889|nr:dephospho-CoA kinase [Brachybacterium sp. Z12]